MMWVSIEFPLPCSPADIGTVNFKVDLDLECIQNVLKYMCIGKATLRI